MLTEVQVKRVQANGAELHYVEQGHGDPLVFVHGSLGDYRTWGLQMAPFAEHYRVIAYSRRYHSPNARPGAGVAYAAAQHAADLGALIEELNLAPAHVVGSSYGAMTALALALGRPALGRSLVLGEPPLLPWLAGVAGGPAVFESFGATAFGPAAQAFARGEEEAGVRLFLDGVLGPGAFDRLPPQARAVMLENAPSMRSETQTPSKQYFAAIAPADAARLRLPVLLLQGEVSPRVFGLISDELARCLPHAERVTIPAASHSMHNMNPPAYNTAVRDFLARH
jgi:pimeloyl-ACP methyl ester carboxylesterase